MANSFKLTKDQAIAQITDIIKNLRNIELDLTSLNQDKAWHLATAQIDKVRDFVSTPEHILGSIKTKHGEIAEHVEVGVHNARQALHQHEMTATFEGVGRTAPEDYLIDGVQVQSKFINGINKSLEHVEQHMDKYDYFGRDGSYYHIPHDQHQIITKVINGEHVDHLNLSSQNAIKHHIATIEQRTGYDFFEVVQPSISDYADVQLGKIDQTLDHHQHDLDSENLRIKAEIADNHQPNFTDAAGIAGASATIGAVFNIGATIYTKHQEGKNFFSGDYTASDWQDLGIKGLKGAASGGISGFSIYALTSFTGLAAPFAAAVVSGTKAISSLLIQYKNGYITKKELYELGIIACCESAMVAVAASIGQAIIPIPILGAIIGSISGQMLISFTKNNRLSFAKELQQDMANFFVKLNQQHTKLVMKIEAKFKALGELTEAAFNIHNNSQLVVASIKLARNYNVAENKIIKHQAELDTYMYS